MTAELDLAAIEARMPAVYDGPWYVQPADDGRWLVGYPTDNPKAGLIATVPDYGEHLAEFIAAARTDVPALVAEVRRLRAARVAAEPLIGEPGPEVTRVYDDEGDMWVRSPQGWRLRTRNGDGDPWAWDQIAGLYGPLTARQPGGGA